MHYSNLLYCKDGHRSGCQRIVSERYISRTRTDPCIIGLIHDPPFFFFFFLVKGQDLQKELEKKKKKKSNEILVHSEE